MGLNKFYTTPLLPSSLIINKSERCSLGESISQYLMLIISTPTKKIPSLPDFGCAIWDLQFTLIESRYRWQNAVAESLEKTISKYETRLGDISVDVKLSETEVDYSFRKYPDIKERAVIVVNAKLSSTGENFSFSTEVYVSPISK